MNLLVLLRQHIYDRLRVEQVPRCVWNRWTDFRLDYLDELEAVPDARTLAAETFLALTQGTAGDIDHVREVLGAVLTFLADPNVAGIQPDRARLGSLADLLQVQPPDPTAVRSWFMDL